MVKENTMNWSEAEIHSTDKNNEQARMNQTEIGLLPEDWEVVSLAKTTKITRLAGYEYSAYWREDIKGTIIGLRGFNIGKNRIVHRDFTFISEKLSKKLLRSKLFINDIIYPCVGTIGNSCVIEEDNKYHIQQNIAKITPGLNKVFPYYLSHFLMSDFGIKEVERFNGTSSQPNVLVGSLRQYNIILPPLPEQEAIAEALSDADAWIESLEQLIAKKRLIKQGAMQELLTPASTSSATADAEPVEAWEVKKLGEVLQFGSGRDYKHLNTGDIPVYGTGGVMTFVDNYLYDGVSVGIGRKGTIDKAVLLSGKFWTVDTLFFTHSFNGVNPIYIYYQFLLIPWKEYNEASGVPSLNKNTLEQIEIIIPSLTEQTRIATILSDMDAELEALEGQLGKARKVKQGMMQELLTGRVRLV